jgi:hypothetical protein
MDSWGTIIAGWVIVMVGIGLYAGWLLLRARVLARELGLGDDPAGHDTDTATTGAHASGEQP